MQPPSIPSVRRARAARRAFRQAAARAAAAALAAAGLAVLAWPCTAPAAPARSAPSGPARGLSTDRPDRTESPITVAPGRVQVEADLLGVHRDRDGGSETRAVRAGHVNLKLGVHRRADLQLVVPAWTRVRLRGGAAPDLTREGFGDVAVRVKVNLAGSEGPPALAVMPFVALPTAAAGLGAGAVEGGLIVPAALDLPAGVGLGLMAQVDAAREEASGARRLDVSASAVLSRVLAGPLAAFVEVWGQRAGRGAAPWTGTFDAGLTLGVGPDAQLDAGVQAGLTRASEDLAAFIGLSVRR